MTNPARISPADILTSYFVAKQLQTRGLISRHLLLQLQALQSLLPFYGLVA